MIDPVTDSEARRRHWHLQGIRLTAIMTTLFGALIVSNWLPVPEWIGYALFVLGAVEFFALPWIVTKAWKRDDP